MSWEILAIVGHPSHRAAGRAGAGRAHDLGDLRVLHVPEYGTTAGRLPALRAGRTAKPLISASQATWLALGLGVALIVAIEAAAVPAARLLGGGDTAAVARASRGCGSQRSAPRGARRGGRPGLAARFSGHAHAADRDRPLEHRLDRPLGAPRHRPRVRDQGSAIANVAAQTGWGCSSWCSWLAPVPSLAPTCPASAPACGGPRRVPAHPLLLPRVHVATGVAARLVTAQLAAQQIGVQLWGFCALFMIPPRSPPRP